MIDLSFIAKSF